MGYSGILNLSASFVPYVKNPTDIQGRDFPFKPSATTGKIAYTGSLNVRRFKQRNEYRDRLVGTALRATIGEAPQKFVLNSPTNSASLLASYPQQLATPLPWTQVPIGKKFGFVIGVLSSSDPEVSRLNAFSSGNFPLETTAR